MFITEQHKLLPHQETCCDFVLNLLDDYDFLGGIIADEMGLGKTGTYSNKYYTNILSYCFS